VSLSDIQEIPDELTFASEFRDGLTRVQHVRDLTIAYQGCRWIRQEPSTATGVGEMAHISGFGPVLSGYRELMVL
jgi:hypothetical protein